MKLLIPSIIGAAMLAVPASATTFTLSSYTLDAYGPPSSDGLEIAIDDLLSVPTTFDLDEGQSVTYTLFGISTPENAFNNDDTNPQPITLGLTFSQPLPNTGAGTGGDTSGQILSGNVLFGVTGGVLEWANDGVFSMSYGVLNDGLLGIEVEETTFSQGACFFLSCGFGDFNASVDVTFTNLQDAAVPEPGALGLLGLGLLGLGAAARRRAA